MDSAFGIDHGEVSKVALPRSTTAHKAGRLTRVVGANAKAAGNKLTEASLSIKGLGRAVGSGTQGVGAGVIRVGQKMKDNPGKTGAATIGVGGGAGYAGYRRAKNSEPKKKAPKGMQ